ncbi:uncharacterized protein K444DRAFT_614870 [Hyaloscypha bicolor E]|uniref:Uncharacterized protein n=1 Tax=Hyaloscypha bicolor E TaxID=1095630 RepID=A0A2J6T379_9HELO|nr:uncharacterized protein K444DRAFT_614870 [Hyaloscypha bicolor E]PMD57467.1 hypothetical protein K444DRAFT_614870 [Hyaloscypha bicolor E]
MARDHRSKHQTDINHITSLRQETKLPSSSSSSCCCCSSPPPPPAAAPPALPSPSPSPLLAVQPLSSIPHQPQHSLASPLTPLSTHQIRARSRPPSPIFLLLSITTHLLPTRLGSETVGHQRPHHLHLLARASGLPPAPAFAFAALVPSVSAAACLASRRQTPAPHIESNLQAQTQSQPQSPIPNPPNPTSTDKNRITLRPEKSRQTPTTAPPLLPLPAVVTCVWQKQQRLFGARFSPRRAFRPSFLGCSIPACCYRSASSAASNLTFALCSGSLAHA